MTLYGSHVTPCTVSNLKECDVKIFAFKVVSERKHSRNMVVSVARHVQKRRPVLSIVPEIFHSFESLDTGISKQKRFF